MKMTTDILHHIQKVAPYIPFPLYWTDLEPRIIGANQACLSAVGAKRSEDIVGKTPHEFYPKEIADGIVAHITLVIQTGTTHTSEDVIQDITTGKVRYYSAIRSPLMGVDGKIVGTIGTSIEITAEKEAEHLQKQAARLQHENEVQMATLQEKENFAMLARKVAHDISSPLASLKMMIPLCNELPEKKRTLLNQAAEGIIDIANNLLNSYQKQANPTAFDIEPRQHLLVSDLLGRLLSQKKMQYRNRPVTIETVIASNAHFAFIRMQATEFRRAMSNLINNAVDALKDATNGVVTIQLTVDANAVVVAIRDNGMGMTAKMLEKMQNRQWFTEGKENGHGLGLQQVWDTLEYNQGIMDVQSTLGEGTLIQLTFPRIAASEWIAENIHLTPDKVIVILDDDESIHTAWNLRFTPLLTSYPTLQIHHFRQGQEALDFLARLSQEQKNLVVFLSDYELLRQGRNGLEVVKESGIKRAILVTSYYSSSKVREGIDQLGIKVLPKQMASIIPIIFANENVLIDVNKLQIPVLSREPAFKESIHIISSNPVAGKNPALQKTDIVLLDDNQSFADAVIFRLSHSKVVTHYPDPTLFLDECEKFAKNTPICIDNNFGLGIDIKGTQVAERLHELEFTRLFIISGDHFEPGALPDYVTLIKKTNLESLDTL